MTLTDDQQARLESGECICQRDAAGNIVERFMMCPVDGDNAPKPEAALPTNEKFQTGEELQAAIDRGECVCPTDAEGNKTEKWIICPVDGDAKARAGRQPKQGRTPASDIRSEKGGIKKSKFASRGTPIERKTELARTGPPGEKSDKERFADVYEQGVKDKTIQAMIDGVGNAFCERCEEDGPSNLADARAYFHFHHQDNARDESSRYNYKTNEPRGSHPKGLLLVCAACHALLEKQKTDPNGLEGTEFADPNKDEKEVKDWLARVQAEDEDVAGREDGATVASLEQENGKGDPRNDEVVPTAEPQAQASSDGEVDTSNGGTETSGAFDA